MEDVVFLNRARAKNRRTQRASQGFPLQRIAGLP